VSEPDRDERIARLRESMRRLELMGGPAAEDALSTAADALEATADAMRCDTRRLDQQGTPGEDIEPAVQVLEFVGDELTGCVTFPGVSIEGNRWVDAGTVSAVFGEFLGALVERDGPVHGWVDLSVDFLSLVPRNHRLTLVARRVRGDDPERQLKASMSTGASVVATAHARFRRRLSA
jgi:hypothetical protein